MKYKFFYKIFTVLFAFIILIALAIPVLATEKEILSSERVANFDIKGIKLGMPQEEVLALFPDANKPRWNNKSLTSSEMDKDEYTYISTREPYVKNGLMENYFEIQSKNKLKGISETIKVEFVNPKYGHGVMYVEYHLYAKALPADIKNNILTKYGKPDSEAPFPLYQASYGNLTTGKWLSVYLGKDSLSLKLKDNYPETLLRKEREIKPGDIKF